MLKRPYFLTGFLTLFIVIFHLYADSHSLYFTYKWLDIPMHLSGGFVIALLGVILSLLYGKKIERNILWTLVILLTLTIGLFWEMYEVLKSAIYGVKYIGHFDVIDTASDLLNDLIGALIALFITYKKNWYA